MSLGTESLVNHDHIPKTSKFVRVKAFPMYGGLGMSAPSLHRQSTDSLMSMVGSQDIVLLLAIAEKDK